MRYRAGELSSDRLAHKVLLTVYSFLDIIDLFDICIVFGEDSRFHIVRPHDAQHLVDPLSDLRIVDGTGDLHSALRISRHKIRRRYVKLLVHAAAERVNPRMLQKPPHNADDRDVLRMARNIGQNAADAPYDHFDADACAGSVAQLSDDIDIRDGIDLHRNLAGASFFHLFIDEREDSGLEAVGRDQKLFIFAVYVAD